MTTDAAPGAVLETTCPRCGTESAGAPWCPECGLNLRVKNDAATAHDTVQVQVPAAAPQGTRRRPTSAALLGAVVAAVAVAGATVAIVLATRGSGTKPTSVAAVTVVRTVPAVTPTTVSVTPPSPAAAEVTAADMHTILSRYADAYSSEDVGLLRSLFAPELVRQNAADPPEGRAQALETYQRQFDALSNPTYGLTNLEYQPGAGEGAADGTYAIEHDTGSASGRIYFHFVSRDGRLLIDEIEIEPSQ